MTNAAIASTLSVIDTHLRSLSFRIVFFIEMSRSLDPAGISRWEVDQDRPNGLDSTGKSRLRAQRLQFAANVPNLTSQVIELGPCLFSLRNRCELLSGLPLGGSSATLAFRCGLAELPIVRALQRWYVWPIRFGREGLSRSVDLFFGQV